MAYKSKFSGEEIDELLSRVKDGDDELSQSVEDLKRDVENKANVNGNYPTLSVGFAEDLVGDGNATYETFSFRPSAGENRNVKNNGAAKVKTIRGNSIIWNQIVKPNIFSSDQLEYGVSGVTITQNANGSYTLNGTTTADVFINLSDEIAFNVGDKVALTGLSSLSSFRFYLNGGYGSSLTTDGVLTCTHEGVGSMCFVHIASNVSINNATINPKVYNLTKMFFAGNEPTTIAEFFTRLPVGVDVNAYKSAQLIPMRVEGLKIVGFNQWDEQWALGTIMTNTGKIVDTTTSIRSKNYIPVFANTKYYIHRGSASNEYVFFYDRDKGFISSDWVANTFTTPINCAYVMFRLNSAYGTTYLKNICINLDWDEYSYKNGTYEPYEVFTRNLSVINNSFADGMKSVGDVYDSIEWDSTAQKWAAIHRVGIRAYTNGDESNMSVVTDKEYTYYALTTPIVEYIDGDFSLDYQVWDFGTEEALVDSDVVSSAFCADIVYEPNALATLKNIPDIITRLSALEALVSSLETSSIALS